ncbi:MAG: hydrogenase small subunit [Anaerolineae bacterium]|nr:hydrogenase small subunit [Anaerolineae bacterium]
MAKSRTEEYPVLWLQGGACTGCSVSLLNSVAPSPRNILVDEILPGKHLNVRFHATIMAGAGDLAVSELKRTHDEAAGAYVLVVEGSVQEAAGGAYAMIGEKDGEEVSMQSWVKYLGPDALAIIAVGTCAAFGGIPAGEPNPTGSLSVQQVLSAERIQTTLINIPGCPPHPDWFVGTVASLLLKGLPGEHELDEYLRPKAFFGQLIHENCPRRAYFDEGKFAKKLSDPYCLYELGCKGPVTHADCPIRLWNNGTNWCIGSGAPCIACVEPTFPDVVAPVYEKITDDALPNIGAE